MKIPGTDNPITIKAVGVWDTVGTYEGSQPIALFTTGLTQIRCPVVESEECQVAFSRCGTRRPRRKCVPRDGSK